MMFEDSKTIFDRIKCEADAAADVWWPKVATSKEGPAEIALYKSIFSRGYVEAVTKKGLYLGNKQ